MIELRDGGVPIHVEHDNRRRVSINGHQEFWQGWFHGWTKDDADKMLAVVETDRGDVSYVEPLKLKFHR